MISSKKQTIYGVLAGLIAYAVVGLTGLFSLSLFWPAYAAADSDYLFTLAMKMARLLVAVLAAIAAGIAAEKISNSNGKAAVICGVVVLCCASYMHLVQVWDKFPVWYHLAYLIPIVPLHVLSAFFVRVDK